MAFDKLQVTVWPQSVLAPTATDRQGLGLAGYRREPRVQALADRLRAVRSSVIRLFVQEYYGLYESKGTYDWSRLDAAIAEIRAAGANPLLSLCMKPPALYPRIDEGVVHPTDYTLWEEFLSAMVQHYNVSLRWNIKYWEIANEPDIGERGGCPYLFSPYDYCRYYERSVFSLLRADPSIRVGGPALASVYSPILPTWLDYCVVHDVPIDFVSWHRYTARIESMSKDIQYAHTLIDQYPKLHVETIIDEWNIPFWGEDGAVYDARLAENPTMRCAHMVAMLQTMMDQGVRRSNYYPIKEVSLARDQFAEWFGFEELERQDSRYQIPNTWALFGPDDQTRPHYYAYQLFQRLTGTRVAVDGNGTCDDIGVLASRTEDDLRILIWNYHPDSPRTVDLSLRLEGLDLRATEPQLYRLDAQTVDAVMQADGVPATPLSGIDPAAGMLTLTCVPYGVYLIDVHRPS